jgi:four helix bundle protein
MAFDALEMSLTVLGELVAVEQLVRTRSRSLADQLNRAADSIVLNLGEGSRRRGAEGRRFYGHAAGSAQEVTTALRVAVIRRYVTRDHVAPLDEPLDRLRAMLWRLSH